MKLTAVGCAPAYTARSGNASSCYLVEHGKTAIALDFGQGAFSELWRYCSPADLDAVVISHLHADHCVDLIPLRHWVKFENGGEGPAIYGPPELRARLDTFQAEADFLANLAGTPLDDRLFPVGGLLVEARRVTHIPDSFAFRVSAADAPDAPGVVYSGDCGVADDLLPLMHPGDTLLCEAALGAQAREAGAHLTAYDAARVAAQGRASSLVLTHILDVRDPDAALAAARDVFSGHVQLAVAGLMVDIR